MAISVEDLSDRTRARRLGWPLRLVSLAGERSFGGRVAKLRPAVHLPVVDEAQCPGKISEGGQSSDVAKKRLPDESGMTEVRRRIRQELQRQLRLIIEGRPLGQ